jgi:hypothetical protein
MKPMRTGCGGILNKTIEMEACRQPATTLWREG